MPGTKATVLIVDDDPAIRMAMSQALAELGYGVRCAEDGRKALEEMEREIPQILLSDLHMPGMTGFELLSVVRRRYPEILTIAMSGAFRGDEAQSGVAADAFYQKGSSIVSLLRMMETMPRSERKQHNQAKALAPDPSDASDFTGSCAIGEDQRAAAHVRAGALDIAGSSIGQALWPDA